jgi:predicted signal transduction protein with EAL and GGDEF domain
VQSNQQTKLSQILNAFTAAALLVSGLLLLSAFHVEGELVRAFCLGAFCFSLIVAVLLFAITRISRALDQSHAQFQQALEVSNELSEKLSYQESHDTLTGLLNRREFEARLQALSRPACRHCSNRIRPSPSSTPSATLISIDSRLSTRPVARRPVTNS